MLHARCRERGIEIALGNRVDRLLVRGDAVVGVAVGDDELEAGAVVLATGGFAANLELIDRWLPKLAQHGEWISYNGPDSSRGDVFALAEQVGARIVGFDRCVQSLKPKMYGKEFDAYLPAWILVVDPNGRRVFDETAPYGITYVRVNAVGGHVFGLFDAQTRADNASPELPTLKTEYPPGTPLPSPIWNPEGITRLLESGAIVECDSLEELAEALGVPAPSMLGTVRRYNELVTQGEDRDFGKPSRFLRRIEHPPFYGVEILTARCGPTACGPQIDASAQVIGETGGAIAGLYAAGECTGGVIGSSYVGSGNSLASAFVFGRTAGRSAAIYALTATPT